MYRLSQIVCLIFLPTWVLSQSPHGENFEIDCKDCHLSDSWTNLRDSLKFDHGKTEFELIGRHLLVDCISCHKTLDFSEAKDDCFSCHTDVHSMTVGNDCVRCHDTQTWLVDDIPELHELNGFPLSGAHGVISCEQCHYSGAQLKFERIGNECSSCHLENYMSAQNPNHASSGFPLICLECHNTSAWIPAPFYHDQQYFPIYSGKHEGEWNECVDCHTNLSDYSVFSCASCHSQSAMNNKHDDVSGYVFDGNACIGCHPDGSQ